MLYCFLLLLNFILSKEELDILNYWHDFYHSSLYFRTPVLNVIMRTFNLHVESLKLHNLYFVATTCICILFLLEHWKCWKKQLVLCFISLLDTPTFYQRSTEANGFCKMLTLYLLSPAQLPHLVHGNSVSAAPGVLHANRLARNYGCTHIVHIYSCCAKMCLWTNKTQVQR